MSNKRVFISFAIEDARYRDFLIGQARNEHSPFTFVDMSVKEPWDSAWKTKCRTKIKGCDGVIALLSGDTPNASGALWEIKCAKEEDVPLVAMYVSKDDRPETWPDEMRGLPLINWTWDEIADFIDEL